VVWVFGPPCIPLRVLRGRTCCRQRRWVPWSRAECVLRREVVAAAVMEGDVRWRHSGRRYIQQLSSSSNWTRLVELPDCFATTALTCNSTPIAPRFSKSVGETFQWCNVRNNNTARLTKLYWALFISIYLFSVCQISRWS